MITEFNKKLLHENQAKLATGSIVDLKSARNKAMLANMMADFSTAAADIEAQAIKQVLRKEFGNSFKFSDDFVARVAAKLKNI